MKHLKMLGLAAIAALGLMALGGAGTASATTLFTTSNLTTPYVAGSEVIASLANGGSAIFTGSGSETLDTCTGSTVQGKTSNQTGTTVSGSISSLTWSGCSTTTDTVANGELSIERTGTEEGKVVGKSSQVTITIFGVSCTYGTGAGTTLGTTVGGGALKISGVSLAKTAGGFLCPSSVGFDAEYTLTSPHSAYIGS